MAGAVERIERDIAALEEAIAAIAKELHSLYSGYINALGQTMQHQLILASYHLCTQGYPNEFLALSFSQRQQLQQSLRQIAGTAKENLLAALHLPSGASDSQPTPEQLLSVFPDAPNTSNMGQFASSDAPEVSLSKPQELAAWQENTENAIAKTLKKASRDSNRLLQQAGILPQKLPEPILEAAAKVEATADSVVAGPPNLLNLVIETEDDDEPQSSSVTHIFTIHLRLAEIELGDPTVMAYRHQIRNLCARLIGIEREYQKKQKERAIAEAELAWRASWFDE
jgi:hypothetical protein